MIDVTLANESMARMLEDWRAVDSETLSCHRYIQYTISTSPTAEEQNLLRKDQTAGWICSSERKEEFVRDLTDGVERKKSAQRINWHNVRERHLIQHLENGLEGKENLCIAKSEIRTKKVKMRPSAKDSYEKQQKERKAD